MTDKSEGPYKLEQVRKTENSNEWFYRVVGPDGFLKIGNLPELNQYFIDLKLPTPLGSRRGWNGRRGWRKNGRPLASNGLQSNAWNRTRKDLYTQSEIEKI